MQPQLRAERQAADLSAVKALAGRPAYLQTGEETWLPFAGPANLDPSANESRDRLLTCHSIALPKPPPLGERPRPCHEATQLLDQLPSCRRSRPAREQHLFVHLYCYS